MKVELQQAIRTGVTASAVAHLSVVTLVLLFAEVHPFRAVTAEPIAVDIVAPHEVVPNRSELPPVQPQLPSPDSSSFKEQAAAAPSPAAAQDTAVLPQQATLSAPRSNRRDAAAQPQAASASPSTRYVSAEPDLSIKYHVMLGLPPELPPSAPQARSGEVFDDVASKAADITSSLVTEFRRRLRTCSTLPKAVAPSDAVKIMLRVFMTPEGKLATEPMLIEASASAKGPLLMQSAISALQSCQPYAMLPADRYGEWKVLDLSFTPQDFPEPS